MTDAATLDLTPVRDRLQWANRHADRIDQLVTDWAATALMVERTTDPGTGRIVHQGRVIGDPPVAVALALSDALHQTRAALDNLVAILRGGPTPKSGYVITGTPEKFAAQAVERLQGVPAWAVAEIRRHQPFGDHGWKYVGERLLQLHDLAILDRHRALLIQGGVIDLGQTHLILSDAAASAGYVARGGTWGLDITTNDAGARPHFGATVLVREPILQYRMWPHYPSAPDLARRLTEAAERVVWAVDAASRNDEGPSIVHMGVVGR